MDGKFPLCLVILGNYLKSAEVVIDLVSSPVDTGEKNCRFFRQLN